VGRYHHHVAFNPWPLPRPKGALAAAYTPAVSRPARDPLGWSSSRLGKNYQVRTILASAAYS
jgi:catechol-2,3-dioxygenase